MLGISSILWKLSSIQNLIVLCLAWLGFRFIFFEPFFFLSLTLTLCRIVPICSCENLLNQESHGQSVSQPAWHFIRAQKYTTVTRLVNSLSICSMMMVWLFVVSVYFINFLYTLLDYFCVFFFLSYSASERTNECVCRRRKFENAKNTDTNEANKMNS